MAIRPHGMNTKTKQKWKDCDNKEWRGCGSEYVWKLVVHQVPRIGSTCGFLDDVPAHSVGWLILSHYFLLETEDLEPLSSSNDVNNGSTDKWFGICRKPLTFHEVTENLIEFGSFISGSPPHFISVHLKLTFLRDFLSEFHHLFSSFFNIIIFNIHKSSTNHKKARKNPPRQEKTLTTWDLRMADPVRIIDLDEEAPCRRHLGFHQDRTNIFRSNEDWDITWYNMM